MSLETEIEKIVDRVVARRLAELHPHVKTPEQIRREAGFLSIHEAAVASGISMQTIRKWERRGLQRPKQEHEEMVSRLARVYGCDTNALFAAIRRDRRATA